MHGCGWHWLEGRKTFHENAMASGGSSPRSYHPGNISDPESIVLSGRGFSTSFWCNVDCDALMEAEACEEVLELSMALFDGGEIGGTIGSAE